MKRMMAIVIGTVLASSLTASADLIAAWENFEGSTAFVPTQQDADTTVSVATTTAHNNWGHWFNEGQSASADGTFGGLSETVASASTEITSSTNALTLNRSDGTIEFTLTNNSGTDRVVDGFYFDSVSKFGNSAKAWELTVSGAISGAPSSGPAPQVNGGFAAATPEQRDHSVDLSGLTDNVWGTGEDIVLTLAFTGAANSSTGGGNELMVDNIAITASVIPEPSTLSLMALVGGLFLMRRRRS